MGTFFAIIFFASAVSILVLLAISVYMFFFKRITTRSGSFARA